ncbi:MAG: hypothetical protein LKF99_04005 [Bifidobacterium sp.]|nr:hypothetical protein [Bifidobacterium sp.]
MSGIGQPGENERFEERVDMKISTNGGGVGPGNAVKVNRSIAMARNMERYTMGTGTPEMPYLEAATETLFSANTKNHIAFETLISSEANTGRRS